MGTSVRVELERPVEDADPALLDGKALAYALDAPAEAALEPGVPPLGSFYPVSSHDADLPDDPARGPPGCRPRVPWRGGGRAGAQAAPGGLRRQAPDGAKD